ncbi:hypothetical protein V6N13_016450 [Hibiscus sabdariffa]|uniref:Uncharacterized protein n=2 Tax=Hibiscus sabdariffa TaxID=183260 RepID=A0ABR2NNG3_9ROSI
MNVKSLDGSLCLIANYCEVHVVDIWMMKEYGVKESWTKLVSFSQSKPFDFVLPLAFSKNGDQVLLNIDDNEIVWYDLRSKRVEKAMFQCLFKAQVSVGSLVPLNDNDAMINRKVMARKRRREMVRKNRKKNTKRALASSFILFVSSASGYGTMRKPGNRNRVAAIAHIMQELYLEFYGVKDLLRFRCVSKPWCSLIDDPDFIKLQLSHSLKTSTHLSLVLRDCYLFSVAFDSPKAAQKLDNPFLDEGVGTEIWGSCNGLLALYNGGEEMALWNPSTRKSQMLSFTEMEFPRYSCLTQFIVYGLGHDPISDDYKLVQMVQLYDEEDNDSFVSEVKVYSLRTNSWRRIKDFPFYLKYRRAYGVLANNALHWVVSKRPESDTRSFVVAFDLGTEEYRVVELPDCSDQGFHMNVRSMGGSLCLISNYWKVHVVDIWVMKEYGVKESWIKLVSVDQSKFTSPFEFVLPLAFSQNGDRVLWNIDDNKFVWYDLRSKRVKKVRVEGVPSSFESEMLVESLVPLNGNGAMINRKDQGKEKQKKKNTKSPYPTFWQKHIYWIKVHGSHYSKAPTLSNLAKLSHPAQHPQAAAAAIG